MLGAVYERKHGIDIMSCVGLSPFHIAAVFVAEASVLGIIPGSLGYILDLMGYRFIPSFVVPLGDRDRSICSSKPPAYL